MTKMLTQVKGFETMCKGVFVVLLVILAIVLVICLVKAIQGPGTADRLIATNMIGTATLVIIGILTVFLEEGYLEDIAIVYALLSFLAVIILTKVYTGVFMERKVKSEKEQAEKQKRQGLEERKN